MSIHARGMCFCILCNNRRGSIHNNNIVSLACVCTHTEITPQRASQPIQK